LKTTIVRRLLTLGLAIGSAHAAQAQSLPDVTRGSTAQCLACHSFEKGAAHGAGPNLHGVVGRRMASAPGFVFSKALRKLGGTWSESELDKWLEDPQAYAPGTKMAYGGLKDAAQRKEVIEVLKALK
jgi:cytochrome c